MVKGFFGTCGQQHVSGWLTPGRVLLLTACDCAKWAPAGLEGTMKEF
jgi:hypothetical protein